MTTQLFLKLNYLRFILGPYLFEIEKLNKKVLLLTDYAIFKKATSFNLVVSPTGKRPTKVKENFSLTIPSSVRLKLQSLAYKFWTLHFNCCKQTKY